MDPRRLYRSLAENYWFLPGLMTAGGIVVGLLAGAVDSWINIDRVFGALRLDRVSAEGARTMLSTAAGSMITVAGVTFSITIAAIVTVTSQFGTRVFSNFMDDRGSQVTLGIFLGTFVYCLVVLGWVRSGAEENGDFVPQVALAGAMVLVLLSVGALIYFIHHIADSLRIETQIDAIGRAQRRAMIRRFEPIGDTSAEPPSEPDWDPDSDITNDQPGYVREIDHRALIDLAAQADTTVRLLVSPGDFAMGGQALVRCCEKPVDAIGVRSAFKLGSSRTAAQDFTYYLDQLVEIAVRALSPGINDPFTAGTCVDWLSDGLLVLSGRQLPAPVLYDDSGTPRLYRRVLAFEDVVGGTVNQLLPYFCADRNAALKLMDALVGCYRAAVGPRRRIFADFGRKLREAAEDHLDPRALAALDRRIEGLDRFAPEEEDSDGETPRAG